MSGFGGHGLRGRTLFLGFWAAMSLPHVLALMDAGPGYTAAGALLVLAVGWGLGRVAYQADEPLGCLFALVAGGGMWLGWWVMSRMGEVPSVAIHLGALIGAAFLPVLLVVARAVIVRRQERADGE